MFSGKSFESTTKSVIFSVWKFLRNARDANQPICIDANTSNIKIIELSSKIMGISITSVRKIINEGLQAETCDTEANPKPQDDSTSSNYNSSMDSSVDDIEPLPPIAMISYRKASPTELCLSADNSQPIKRKCISFEPKRKKGPKTCTKLDRI